MKIHQIALKEIIEQVLRSIPEEVNNKIRVIKPGPQIISFDKGKPVTCQTNDYNGIALNCGDFSSSTFYYQSDDSIKIYVYQSYTEPSKTDWPEADVMSRIVGKRSIPLSDPLSIDKAAGFLIKMIQRYICPFQPQNPTPH